MNVFMVMQCTHIRTYVVCRDAIPFPLTWSIQNTNAFSLHIVWLALRKFIRIAFQRPFIYRVGLGWNVTMVILVILMQWCYTFFCCLTEYIRLRLQLFAIFYCGYTKHLTECTRKMNVAFWSIREKENDVKSTDNTNSVVANFH